MEIEELLHKVKKSKVVEASLWKDVDPALAYEALVKVIQMSDNDDFLVLMQYASYLPPKLADQIYLLGKIYELQASGYVDVDISELVKEVRERVKKNKDKGFNSVFSLLLFLLLKGS